MEITIDELLKMNSVHIIDVRNPNRYLQGHIPGAISVFSNELFNHPNRYLDVHEVYYLYCESGMRSRKLVSFLNELGYHTVNIVGGYHNYLLRK